MAPVFFNPVNVHIENIFGSGTDALQFILDLLIALSFITKFDKLIDPVSVNDALNQTYNPGANLNPVLEGRTPIQHKRDACDSNRYKNGCSADNHQQFGTQRLSGIDTLKCKLAFFRGKRGLAPPMEPKRMLQRFRNQFQNHKCQQNRNGFIQQVIQHVGRQLGKEQTHSAAV